MRKLYLNKRENAPSLLALILALLFPTLSWAQSEVNYMPEIEGTVRAKYEYQPEIEMGRFLVRNARFSVSGKVSPIVSYKAEVDLSNEGKIVMLDAYSKIDLTKGLDFTIGQMRVPFSIDAHRGPHKQYFPNRSFIAKQVGNVRDVGATLKYSIPTHYPIILEAGLFNGSGLTNLKNFWTDQINFTAKATFNLPAGFSLVGSMHKIKPYDVTIEMYDVGINFHKYGWHVEAEWLYKKYKDSSFEPVNAFNSFICYDLPLQKTFSKISFLARYDMMEDHSRGQFNELGKLTIDDAARKRITGGVTLSLDTKFISDIRINYEKYLYGEGADIKISEQDKFVIELMTRF